MRTCLKLVKRILSHLKAVGRRQLYLTLQTNTKNYSLNIHGQLPFHRHKTRSANSSSAKFKSKVTIIIMKKTTTKKHKF